MKTTFEYADLADDTHWDSLANDLDPDRASRVLQNLLETFRSSGARQFLEESAYIDRDFSAAYSMFYSTLYRQRSKFCRRIHFFAADLSDVFEIEAAGELAEALKLRSDTYMGYIIVRPLRHAPVSSAVVSVRHFTGSSSERSISVRSEYRVHLVGTELKVEGIPVTEQDSRTGSCAQATIWTAGRHLHNSFAMPWFSVIDITEAAIKPTDSILASSLPAGSSFLTDDNMVRALRAMGEHPIVYSPNDKNEWEEPPHRTIARYVDSGIPVIVGLQRGDKVGHAVVAVGTVTAVKPAGSSKFDDSNVADVVTAFLVNDDQRGAYVTLPVAIDRDDETSSGSTNGQENVADGFSLADAIFILVPLPNKVFIKAEVAETLARDKVKQIALNRATHVSKAFKGLKLQDWNVDPAFYAASGGGQLIARTYLTHGWKYRLRLIANAVPEAFKAGLSELQLPRYVWVTEFSIEGDLDAADPCDRRVRGHVVVDATGSGSDFDDSVLLTHIPGVVLVQSFDPKDLSGEPTATVQVLMSDKPYFPKVRGWPDYSACPV